MRFDILHGEGEFFVRCDVLGHINHYYKVVVVVQVLGGDIQYPESKVRKLNIEPVKKYINDIDPKVIGATMFLKNFGIETASASDVQYFDFFEINFQIEAKGNEDVFRFQVHQSIVILRKALVSDPAQAGAEL